jgi:hypothetical protein
VELRIRPYFGLPLAGGWPFPREGEGLIAGLGSHRRVAWRATILLDVAGISYPLGTSKRAFIDREERGTASGFSPRGCVCLDSLAAKETFISGWGD